MHRQTCDDQQHCATKHCCSRRRPHSCASSRGHLFWAWVRVGYIALTPRLHMLLMIAGQGRQYYIFILLAQCESWRPPHGEAVFLWIAWRRVVESSFVLGGSFHCISIFSMSLVVHEHQCSYWVCCISVGMGWICSVCFDTIVTGSRKLKFSV